MIWGVLLAGGSGTRFWPLSTPSNPKQLLPLTEGGSTGEAAVARLEGLIPRERLLVVTGQALAQRLRDTLRIPDDNVLIEPRAASTAPALLWATWEAKRRDSDAAVLSMHADWWVDDPRAFRDTATTALAVAREHDRLVTVGMVPTRPETGYGYIVPGTRLGAHANTVARFQEKPTAATALDLMAGGALWNSGLFAWTADRLLREVASHTPELAPHLPLLVQGNVPAFFAALTPISIDVGVLERSQAIAVVPGRFQWDDVGNWEALSRVRERDASGNVSVGPVVLRDTHDSIVWSDSDTVVLGDVSDLVVIAANGRVLVTRRDRAADLKQLLDSLPPDVRDLP